MGLLNKIFKNNDIFKDQYTVRYQVFKEKKDISFLANNEAEAMKMFEEYIADLKKREPFIEISNVKIKKTISSKR